MGFAKAMLAAVVVLALAAYAFDCLGMTTPEQAMRCCNSMQCSSHGHHGQDCCKTMPRTHAPFIQAPSMHGVSLDQVAIAAVPGASELTGLSAVASTIAAYSHAPPVLGFLAPLPIRI
jgi:hypothetical protein